MKKILFAFFIIIATYNAKCQKLRPSPVAVVLRAYNVTVTGQPKPYLSFVCFYAHKEHEKERATYYYALKNVTYGGSPDYYNATWNFSGYGGTPPDGETLQKQDLLSTQHVLDKKKIPHSKGIELTKISVADGNALTDKWVRLERGPE